MYAYITPLYTRLDAALDDIGHHFVYCTAPDGSPMLRKVCGATGFSSGSVQQGTHFTRFLV